MTRSGEPEPGPPGLLRLFTVFHETELLGAARSVLNVVPDLADLGWTTSAWVPGRGPLADEAGRTLASVSVGEKPIAYSVRGWRASPGLSDRIQRTPAYLRRFRAALLVARPHVVHINTLRALPEAVVARSLGLPVVIHVHEVPDQGTKETLVMRSAGRVADVLVAVSGAAGARLRPHVGETPTLVVRNGVPRVEIPRDPQAGFVGTLGTICRTKGTDVYLKAAALARSRAPELRFEHAGHALLDNDVEFARTIEELSGAAALGDGFEFLGPKDPTELLARWEIFVLASRQDAFPLASLEAMQAGLPVIAANVGGISEQITHLETGILVAPERPEELADWIVRLHEDPALRERIGQAAAESVRSLRTTAEQARGLHRAYLAALNLRYAPPPVRQATLAAL